MLIALAAFNNLLAGVFMALMDAYGLSLVSVETWGFLFGGISMAFIVGGLARRPVRARASCRCASILLGNLVNWTVCSVVHAALVDRPARRSGCSCGSLLIPVIEAAEQTVLQRSIPFERQGRVFGFAQLVENAAAPVTAFLIGPLAETVVMPFMTDGRGADAIGELVRHRARARPRPDVHARRPDRRGHHPRGAGVSLLPRAERRLAGPRRGRGRLIARDLA